MNLEAAAAHAERSNRLLATLGRDGGAQPLGLAKRTSNLFRDRREAHKRRLDLSGFQHVLELDPDAGWVDVEGSTTYEQLVDATLPFGAMPAVVPQLKTITVGGAAAGVGIEATSFREGLVHHGLLELEVLLADGSIVLCTPGNEHSDLFHGFANSYGTLGYALRLRLRTRPVRPFVEVRHERCADAETFLEGLVAACADPGSDFVDGVVFDAGTFVVNRGSFAEAAPWSTDYGFERIYYRSLLERELDYLAVRDYLWRWDTDWFWCSRNFGLQRPWLRRLVGRERLNSRTYTRLMRWNARWGVTRRWSRLHGRYPESVIQDVDIPLPQAAAFLTFLLHEIGILPIWACPLQTPGGARSPLYPLDGGTLHINFGFWDVIENREAHPTGYWNRRIEREVMRLGGIKSLYSESYFTQEEFDAAYGMRAFAALKARYDPGQRLLGLYEKCVRGA
jgi:FAD/FMN-containing dehydrogenase